MSGVILPGQGPQPKPEFITLDHPVFAEIAQALTEVLQRTEKLAMLSANIVQILGANGLLEDEESPEEPVTDDLADAEEFARDQAPDE